MMTKEMIYEEFNIVKNKDAKKKKTITLTQLHICKMLTLKKNTLINIDI